MKNFHESICLLHKYLWGDLCPIRNTQQKADQKRAVEMEVSARFSAMPQYSCPVTGTTRVFTDMQIFEATKLTGHEYGYLVFQWR